MSVTRIPDPTNTVQPCPGGCGLPTVMAEIGHGRSLRVHCGTYTPACRPAPAVPAPRRAA